MNEKPELLPCPFCGCTTIIAATGPRAIRPYFECDWCGAEGPIEEPDEDPPQGWNVRSPADHPTVKALVAEADARVLEGLLTDSNVQFAMGQRICCDGRECGCMGADVGSYIQHLADGYRAEAAAIRGETT